MRTDLIELRSFLNSDYKIRAGAKPSYSKRAYARDLGISATVLGEFLTGKRDLSFKNVDRVFRYLNKRKHCSFCDKAQREVRFLVGGPRKQFICDGCIGKCVEIGNRFEKI